MSAGIEKRALDLFEDWLEQPESERAIWLRVRVADDAALRQAVQVLIDAHQHAELLPTQPPEPMLSGALVLPERIGVYRLVRSIGQGGMGQVFHAERDDGLFAQTVAIKLIRPGLFSPRAARQFAREREILAGLQHPNIARLYDGGATEDGLSYFVMERIDGVPIDHHCDAAVLTLRQRVALLLPLCDAVQYAHGKLIVHADIKPANVLVQADHGPKLLDFGISRLAQAGDGVDAEAGGLSPRYASPQQRAGAVAVPSDDVYALGKLLGELLADQAVDVELAAVIAQAQAQEPSARQISAAALAEDLQRWLDGRPVRALPASRWRSARLFVRRHRIGVPLAAAALLALIAATIISSVLYRRAEARFAETRSLANYLLTDVVDRLEPMPGGGELRRDIAGRARQSLQRLSEVPGASAELQAETAQAYARIGTILVGSQLRDARGAGDAGMQALQQAETLLRQRIAEQPARADLRQSLAATLVTQAHRLAADTSHSEQALRRLDEARRLLPPQTTASFDAALIRIDADLAQAVLLDKAGDYQQIEPLLQPATRLAAALQPATQAQRNERALRLDRLWALIGDARWYGDDDKPGALTAYGGSVNALAPVADPGDIRITKRLAYAEFNVASSKAELGREKEALVDIRNAVRNMHAARRFDGSVELRHQENILTLEYAQRLNAAGLHDEAMKYANGSVEGRRALARLEPDSYEELRALPVALRVLGDLQRDAGQASTACATYGNAVAHWQALDARKLLSPGDRNDAYAQVKERVAGCP